MEISLLKILLLKYLEGGSDMKKVMIFIMLLFISLLTGCETDERREGEYPLLPPEIVESSGGTHHVEMEETAEMLIFDGISEYKIIVPEEDDSKNTLAIQELIYFLKLASGVELVVSEEDLDYSEDLKYISIGINNYSKTAGIEYKRAELKATGVKIKTQGKSIFIGGISPKGNLNGVYEFLKQTVGFKIFAENIYDVDVLNQIPLYDYNIVEVPDIEYVPAAYGSASGKYISRLRYDLSHDIFMPVDGFYWHNTFKFLPKEKHLKNHPGWYSTSGHQLCFTARGDEGEYQLMKETFFEKLKEVVKAYPHAETVTVTAEDIHDWCNCSACQELVERYNTGAATQIKFVNEIAEMLEDWIASNDEGVSEDRVVNIAFFAYQATTNAPVYQDGDEYKIIDDEIKLHKNVFVFYAPILAMYNQTFNEIDNKYFLETMEKWKVVSDKMYLWVYQTNFHNYLYPFNSYDIIQENYKLFKSFEVQYLFDQGQWDTGKSTGFSEFKVWLTAQLRWNVDYDVTELTDQYFTYVYGPAKEEMLKLFNQIKTHFAYLENNKGLTGYIYYKIADPEYWPKHVIDQFIVSIDEALLKIEPLKGSNYENYLKYREGILVESVFPRFVSIMEYAGYYSETELQQMKRSLLKDFEQLGFSKWFEGVPLTNLTNDW